MAMKAAKPSPLVPRGSFRGAAVIDILTPVPETAAGNARVTAGMVPMAGGMRGLWRQVVSWRRADSDPRGRGVTAVPWARTAIRD